MESQDWTALIIVIVVAVVTYVILLKLMWDWYADPFRPQPRIDPMVMVLLTGVVVGVFVFTAYVILIQKDSDGKAATLIMLAAALVTFGTAYFAYFKKRLQAEPVYLLLISLALQASIMPRLYRTSMYTFTAQLVGVLCTFYILANALQDVKL